ncbi:hypothetical protein [Streptomyces sp. NPDC000878]
MRTLLEKGADPDTADADALPVLCVAVAAYDEAVAEALVEGGADPDRVLPDGTTPLWRAVDGPSASSPRSTNCSRAPSTRPTRTMTVCWTLTRRRSFETWSAVVAHRHDAAPAHRRFVLDYVRRWALVHSGDSSYEKQEREFLAAWAAEETDSRMLAKVLDVYTEYRHQGQEAIGLRYAGHPDPRVRREVPYALSTYGSRRAARG